MLKDRTVIHQINLQIQIVQKRKTSIIQQRSKDTYVGLHFIEDQ